MAARVIVMLLREKLREKMRSLQVCAHLLCTEDAGGLIVVFLHDTGPVGRAISKVIHKEEWGGRVR